MEGNVALFPLTFKCLLDASSPPSITSHFTESAVFDLTKKDIIPPISYIKSEIHKRWHTINGYSMHQRLGNDSFGDKILKKFFNNKNVKGLNALCKALEDHHAILHWDTRPFDLKCFPIHQSFGIHKVVSNFNILVESDSSHTINKKRVPRFNVIDKIIIVHTNTICSSNTTPDSESEFLPIFQYDWLW